MPAETDVSVIIPTRDRARLLKRAVGAALRQEGVTVEVIVVDDGSTTDEPAKMLRSLDESRLRLLHGGGRGVSSARNLGLAAADARWVAFLDDDDLWAPDKLAVQLAAAHARDASFVYTSAAVLDEHLRVTRIDLAPDPPDIASALLRFNAVPGGGSGVLTRTELARNVGGFDQELADGEDWDMWIRLSQAGRAAASAAPLTGYMVHALNLHRKDPEVQMAAFDRIERKYRDLRGRQGVSIDGRWFTRTQAGVQRRAGQRRVAARLYWHGALRYRSPGNAVRALTVLTGEQTMRLRRRPSPPPAEVVPWLDHYRDERTARAHDDGR